MENQYRIETVQDFLKLPAEKIDACLAEFSDALKHAKELEGRTQELAKMFGKSASGLVKFEGFTWIDDGKTEKQYNTSVEISTSR